MINERWRLSIGAPTGVRIIGIVFGVFLVAAGTVFAAAMVLGDRMLDGFTDRAGDCVEAGDISGIPPELLPSDTATCGGALPDGIGPLQVVGLVVGIPLALLGVYAVLRMLRTAAWLDGTSLRVRGALRTRTVDLATATVTAGVVTHRTTDPNGRTAVTRVPTLTARDPSTGRTVTLPLHGLGLDQLPPPELRRLADAMTTARPTSDADALRVAGQLRDMADNPLELPRH